MTGKEFKELAANVPDNAIVKREKTIIGYPHFYDKWVPLQQEDLIFTFENHKTE